jgi:hypothetical protein
VYTVFVPYPPCYTLSPHLPLPLVPARQYLFCPLVLWFQRKKNDIFVLLKHFHLSASMSDSAILKLKIFWEFHTCMIGA